VFCFALMSIRYGQICPVSKAAELLGERWTLFRELVLGTTRFNDFQRALSQLSPTLLTKRLNQLERGRPRRAEGDAQPTANRISSHCCQLSFAAQTLLDVQMVE
jgi:DNA-binding HxlR family transcriptional regulator